MVVSVKEVLYLGNYADADTNEFSNSVENTSVYTGVFGSPGAPLSDQQTNVTFDDANNSGEVATDNAGFEQISYDVGGGPVTTQIDSLAVVDLTVTYADGSSTYYTNAVMFQDTNGNLFLGNSNFAGTDLNGPAPIQSINVANSIDSNFAGVYHNALQEFVCYLPGTLILTDLGQVPIENLSVGQRVATMDHGFQTIRWIKGETVARSSKMMPVRIAAGAMGTGLPRRDLLISQQHRLLVRSKILLRITGEAEGFVRAKDLIGLPGIALDKGPGPVTYYHLMCDAHEIIFANGVASETLFLGPQAAIMVGAEARDELLAIFSPEDLGLGPSVLARCEIRGEGLRKLIFRHKRNRKSLQQNMVPVDVEHGGQAQHAYET